MRAEKVKRYLIVLLAVVLVALAPISYIRVLTESNEIDPDTVGRATGVYSSITDRDGEAIFKGSNLYESIYGNLLGEGSSIDNSIYTLYKDELKLTGFNGLLGMESVSEKNAASIKTTLLGAADQEKIQAAFSGQDGSIFAYNYATGEVYVCMSLPSYLTDDGTTENGFVNACLSGLYIPGSTAKVVAVACALEQNKLFTEFTYTCEGAMVLPDGNTVTCTGVHGSIGLKEALGHSCNCYMAALITQLDVEQTQQILQTMGIYQGETGTNGTIDKLTYQYSRTVFNSNTTFDSVWGLIGQGSSEFNPVSMARIAGAIANEGKAAHPYIIQSIVKRGTRTTYSAKGGDMQQLVSAGTAKVLSEIWGTAVDDHYRDKYPEMSGAITLAKTGTSQLGDGTNNRFLVGTIEEYNVAFFIAVEDTTSALPIQIATALAEVLSDAQ